jgi:ribosome-associated protein
LQDIINLARVYYPKLEQILMVKKKVNSFSLQLSDVIVHGMQEKKANEITRLDLRTTGSSMTDFFVICHADSPAQISAIAKSVEEEVFKALKTHPWRKEGFEQGEWILLDFVDVVVHIFRTEKRQHYGIEELWGDAESHYFQSA